MEGLNKTTFLSDITLFSLVKGFLPILFFLLRIEKVPNLEILSFLFIFKLSTIVFRDKQKLKLLNSIVHPSVNRHFTNYCKSLKDIYIIKEVAIIFETGTQNKFDKIILVRAPKEDRVKRIINRDKCNRQDAINRINNQIADDDKTDQCDFIIDNISLEEISNKVLEIHNSILNSI